MKDNMEKKLYETRVIPFVRYEKRRENGKIIEVAIDNFSWKERSKLSCEPKMFRKIGESLYIEEMPLVFTGGTSIKGFLCYVFKDLNEEEQKKYFDRSIVIHTTEPDVVPLYGKDSKKILNKKRVK